MKFKPRGKIGWLQALEANDGGAIDTYGGAVMCFAKRWADAMEEAMAEGLALEDCADSLSHQVDDSMGRYGLTGFQYGCAVSILSQYWMHGERLRRWHNLETQMHGEGERANEGGGVLNPALLCVEKGE